MTGGTTQAKKINIQIATLCQKYKIGMGLGSQRIAVENKVVEETFQIRSVAPDILVFGNLGAVQLNYGYSWKEVDRSIDMIDADALFLHLNPLQEAIQPEGNRNFSSLLSQIKEVLNNVKKPVFIKEVGNGLSYDVAQRLFSVGVKGVSTEGRGGTNWALIEGERAQNSSLGQVFEDWGIPTPESIKECRKVDGLSLIAGGGVLTGVDIAKSLALGADVTSIGKPLLEALLTSYETAEAYIEQLIREFKIALFCTGMKDVASLREKGKEVLRKK